MFNYIKLISSYKNMKGTPPDSLTNGTWKCRFKQEKHETHRPKPAICVVKMLPSDPKTTYK